MKGDVKMEKARCSQPLGCVTFELLLFDEGFLNRCCSSQDLPRTWSICGGSLALTAHQSRSLLHRNLNDITKHQNHQSQKDWTQNQQQSGATPPSQLLPPETKLPAAAPEAADGCGWMHLDAALDVT